MVIFFGKQIHLQVCFFFGGGGGWGLDVLFAFVNNGHFRYVKLLTAGHTSSPCTEESKTGQSNCYSTIQVLNIFILLQSIFMT